MCSKAAKNQNAWSPIGTFLSLIVKYTLELLQADVRVSISRFIARILPSRRREHSLITSISSSQLNDYTV